jgi:hypothetical protein
VQLRCVELGGEPGEEALLVLQGEGFAAADHAAERRPGRRRR